MSGPRRLPGDAGDIVWRTLGDAEFVTRATPVVEAWLAAGRSEPRLLVALDDELQQRLLLARARSRRAGVPNGSAGLRALAQLILMALEHACAQGVATMSTRALRLAGVCALFSLLAGEPVATATWQLAHGVYARAEAGGNVAAVNELGLADAALYVRMLLLSTLSGNGMSARQIDKCFDWMEEWSRGIVPERAFDAQRHYFGVDLGGGAGLVPVRGGPGGAATRYIGHAQLAERIASARSEYFRQISVSTLGEYDTNPLFEYHDALHQLSRYWEYVAARMAGRDTGRQRVDGVLVPALAGYDACIAAARTGSIESRWALSDLSPTGAGFRVDRSAPPIEKGALALFADPESGAWVLATAVRVVPTGEARDVGVKRLADHWRVVTLLPEGDAAGPASSPAAPIAAFFVFGDESRGLADSLVIKSGSFDPDGGYLLKPGAETFRVRLARVIQSAGDWERVGFDVIKRLKA
ncbi:MAG: hypothetical protein JNM90_04250 [Burkholderiales bacterium]|nr:hypothetical protein [Burkholderiales bacterium]